MTEEMYQLLISCIARKEMAEFYSSKEWRRLRREILKADKGECQICKAKGMYAKANHVHHINYVMKHPELALSVFYKSDDGTIKKNLISVCKTCHETVCHPERLRWNVKEPLTLERW